MSAHPADTQEPDGSEFLLLPARPKPPKQQPFYIHPSSWTGYQVFEACQTQWRLVSGLSSAVYQGIDYASVAAAIDLMGIKKRKRVFQHVRLLEAGAMSVINNG
ncbi:MAG: DUF1799 domain-containing protein [Anaerolineae bacterium]|nr:DUF1799 domain-containing protein [Anaerolineae bacterium]